MTDNHQILQWEVISVETMVVMVEDTVTHSMAEIHMVNHVIV